MKDPAHARRTPWRDNIEALVVALLLAVVLKHFIVEAYKIPSGSMQPTLMGNDETGVFDRILVDKVSYWLRDPERWEVAVFRYPLDRSKSFVKRIAGIGPEELAIRDGDVWHRPGPGQPWRIARRPPAVLRETMRRLDLGPPPEGRPSRWRPVGATSEERWSVGPRRVAARGDGRAAFVHDVYGLASIMDGFTDGYPPAIAGEISWNRPTGQNPVADLRWESTARALEGLQELEVELGEGDRLYAFRFPGPAAPGEAPSITLVGTAADRTVAAPDPWSLPAGRPVRIAAQNVDDLLTLEVDGQPILEVEIEPGPRLGGSLAIRTSGAGVDLTDIAVWRDVYYTTDRASRTEWTLPAGHYFMLGDNTQDSADSREWKLIAKKWPGNGNRWVLGAYRNRENPRTESTVEGRMTFFRDRWGELHWWPAGTDETGPYQEAPFVPRQLILGRAMLVFWPWIPSRHLWRQHWIH